MKTLNEALKYLANEIWENGESNEESCQGLIPFSYYNKTELTPYEKASEIIHKQIKATHFDRYWKERGKTVILRFYKGDSLGACLNLTFIDEKIVEVTT
jgi:hypothetical protein